MSSWICRQIELLMLKLTTSSNICTKPHVGSRISSCPSKPLSCIEKHWSEMSTWEKVQAGPFVCIVNPDEYDNRWGKYLEYFVLFKSEEEYYEQKNYVIETGRWAEFVQQ
jgi:hypothetical protein